MRTKSIALAWITVKNFQKSVKFYTEVLGLKLIEINEEWGWAELEGHDGGCMLGIAQYQDSNPQDDAETKCPIKPGQNSVLSLEVEHLEQAISDLQKNGAHLVGKMEVIPGEIKMQLIQDLDGNFVHVTQTIKSDHPLEHVKHEHKGGCCGGH